MLLGSVAVRRCGDDITASPGARPGGLGESRVTPSSQVRGMITIGLNHCRYVLIRPAVRAMEGGCESMKIKKPSVSLCDLVDIIP